MSRSLGTGGRGSCRAASVLIPGQGRARLLPSRACVAIAWANGRARLLPSRANGAMPGQMGGRGSCRAEPVPCSLGNGRARLLPSRSVQWPCLARGGRGSCRAESQCREAPVEPHHKREGEAPAEPPAPDHRRGATGGRGSCRAANVANYRCGAREGEAPAEPHQNVARLPLPARITNGRARLPPSRRMSQPYSGHGRARLPPSRQFLRVWLSRSFALPDVDQLYPSLRGIFRGNGGDRDGGAFCPVSSSQCCRSVWLA